MVGLIKMSRVVSFLEWGWLWASVVAPSLRSGDPAPGGRSHQPLSFQPMFGDVYPADRTLYLRLSGTRGALIGYGSGQNTRQNPGSR